MSLANAQYVNLSTFRRTGVEVHTPVWFAVDNGTSYVFSAGDAGKVKRIRANGRARVAACDARGKLRGDWIDATARLVDDPAEIERAYRALRRKYGWQMWLTDLGSRLTGRIAKRQMIGLVVDEAARDTEREQQGESA